MMNNSELDFCLLIPCYNNAGGLIASLSSVKYDPQRFLIVVVDDGSKEPLMEEEIQNSLPQRLPLQLIHLGENKGITVALNTGLQWIMEHCNTVYIARLDCGDTCHPERFYKQVRAMNGRPEAGLSGTWCLFEEKGTGYHYEYRTPVGDREIRKAMYFRNVFIHPTVIFKKNIIGQVGFYPSGFELVEDYALFWLMMRSSQTFVLNEILVICEINRNGISFKNKSKQLIARQKIIRKFGTDWLLKFIAIIRLNILYILPKRLLLLLKHSRG